MGLGLSAGADRGGTGAWPPLRSWQACWWTLLAGRMWPMSTTVQHSGGSACRVSGGVWGPTFARIANIDVVVESVVPKGCS